jgi:hypothetical protein
LRAPAHALSRREAADAHPDHDNPDERQREKDALHEPIPVSGDARAEENQKCDARDTADHGVGAQIAPAFVSLKRASEHELRDHQRGKDQHRS